MADAAVIFDSVQEIARKFASQRRERQLRRELDPQDFKVIREAGFLLPGFLPNEVACGSTSPDPLGQSPRSSECSPGAIPPSRSCHPCTRLSSLFGSVRRACRLLILMHGSHNARRSLRPCLPETGGGRLLPSPEAAATSARRRQSPDSTGVENGGFRARNTSVQVPESRRL